MPAPSGDGAEGAAAPSFDRGRRISATTWVAVVAVLVTCAGGARVHAFLWRHASPIGFDDGYTMALAERIIGHRFLPYVDGVSHRGPLLYWSLAVTRLLTGPGWKAARLLSLVTTYATVLLTFAVGASARRPIAGAFAAAFVAWAVFVVLSPSPGFAITGEGVASPFAVAALLFTSLAIHRGTRSAQRNLLFASAGAAAALSGLAKQTALPVVVPIAAWAAAHLWSTPSLTRRERRAGIASLLLAFAGVLAAVVLLYAAHGGLRAFFYWYYEYNRTIYAQAGGATWSVDAFVEFMNANPWPVGGLVFVLAWTLARPFRGGQFGPRGVVARYAGMGLELTAAFLALVLFAVAVRAMRYWGHYFLPVLPFAALVMGLRGEATLSSGGARPGPWAGLVALASITAFVLFTTGQEAAALERAALRGEWPNHDGEPVCRTIASYSRSPSDSLFVWGFAGDIYITCRRPPATRFPYTTFVAGIVPPDWLTPLPARIARGAPAALVEDLQRERPAVIIDAPESMGNIGLGVDPAVAAFVAQEYCAKETAPTLHDGTVGVYVRRDLPACAGK